MVAERIREVPVQTPNPGSRPGQLPRGHLSFCAALHTLVRHLSLPTPLSPTLLPQDQELPEGRDPRAQNRARTERVEVG